MPNPVLLPGSRRSLPLGARYVGPSDPKEPVEITVYLRRRNAEVFHELLLHNAATTDPARHTRLSAAELFDRFGAHEADHEAVVTFGERHGMEAHAGHPSHRSVTLRGNVGSARAAFGVELEDYQLNGKVHRLRSGPLFVPSELDGVIVAALGTDNRPIARPHVRVHPEAEAVSGSYYTVTQVTEAYHFPPATTGAGEGIGIVELDGGFDPQALANHYAARGLPAPPVVQLGFGGAGNNPDLSLSARAEVYLDTEVAGEAAPGAEQTVIFAPNTDAGFLGAFLQLIHNPRVTVISNSWGSASCYWTRSALNVYDSAFADAALLGKTICVSSGDGGSDDYVGDGQNHVDYPAASPHVVACGGTSLDLGGGTPAPEVVWDNRPWGGSSGGGISGYFSSPPYQQNAPLTQDHRHGRGVPDVAGHADPVNGYPVSVDGRVRIVGGTSAWAPMQAALFCRINEVLVKSGRPRVGLPHAAMYAHPEAFKGILQGSNGAFSAAPGWNPCSGLGSPDGVKLLAAFMARKTMSLRFG